MMESLPRKLHLKQRLYFHRLVEGTHVIDHISTFKEIVTN